MLFIKSPIPMRSVPLGAAAYALSASRRPAMAEYPTPPPRSLIKDRRLSRGPPPA
jgi:hypothetical protein